MRYFLDFEKPIAELESKIDELRKMSEAEDLNIAEEVAKLTEKADRQLRATYAKLTAWQKTQVARHPERPKANDFIRRLITDWTPLAGDRAYAEDAAILSGLGRFRGRRLRFRGRSGGPDGGCLARAWSCGRTLGFGALRGSQQLLDPSN